MTKSVILMGGGIDSTALLLWLVNRYGPSDLVALHFNYDQLANYAEKQAVKYFCDKYKVQLKYVAGVPIPSIAHSAILRGFQPDKNKLEGRNAIFVMMAATYAADIGADKIYLGYHAEPYDAPFPDATKDAVRGMQICICSAYKPFIELWAPFEDKTRSEILKIGYDLDPEIITHAHTCYLPTRGGCGKCVHCKQREIMILNLKDGTNEPLPVNA